MNYFYGKMRTYLKKRNAMETKRLRKEFVLELMQYESSNYEIIFIDEFSKNL